MAQNDKQLIGDSQKKDWRPFDKSLFFDGVNDFAYPQNYNLTKGITKSFLQWVNINEVWSFSFWSKEIFYLSMAGQNEVGLNISITPYFQQKEGNAGNFKSKYKLESIPLDLSVMVFNTITNDGSGNPNGLKNYRNRILLETLVTSTVVNNNLVLPISDFSIGTFGGINRSTDQGNNPNPIYSKGSCADIRLWENYILTSSDINNLHNGNWQTDVNNSKLVLRLPMTENVHFANNTPVNFCSALDISGNNNHFIIQGQGTSPTLVNFY